jgi:Chitobiase/beta-hexosaminidase C-terminal domain
MKNFIFAALAFLGICVTASAITVTTPASGAQLKSPFSVVASTSTCGSATAVSMGYSIDSGSAVIEPTSFSATVTATPGAHVLHVKCWGQKTNDQVLLNITVVQSAPASDITVTNPVNGAQLTSPFNLAASTRTCASTPAASMGYSIDGGHTTSEPASFSASITANPGTHVLAVKCTGQSVTDQMVLNIHVVPPPTAATPRFSIAAGTYTTKQVVTLSDATAGAKIYYTIDGSGPSTSSLCYSGPISVSSSLTIEAIAVAAGYTNSGLARADYLITSPKGPTIPPNAISETQVQLLPNWRIKHDPGTPGASTGAMTVVSDPSLSGQAEQFYTTFTGSGGELYSLTYGNDSAPENFVYDAQVWIDEGSQIANLEMDNNQVIPNGDTVIYAFQCSGNAKVWEYSSNAGTPTAPVVKWLRSSAPCNPADWTTDTWHHVQISYSRDNVGNVTYHSAWLDGVESPINQTVNSDFTLGWAAGTLVTNFQVDGAGASGSATLYLDNLTIYRW